MDEEQQNAIKLKAYQIWDGSGRPDGEHESHWHQALKELGLTSPVEQPIETTPSVRSSAKNTAAKTL
jgi:hypothetical protein